MQAARSADSHRDRATASSSERLCNILAALRGVALGTQNSPKSQKDAFPLFLNLFEPTLKIQMAYKHYPDLIYHLLRFAGDLVEGYISFLEVCKRSKIAFHFSGHLIPMSNVALTHYAAIFTGF